MAIALLFLLVGAEAQPAWMLRGSGAYVVDGKRVFLGVGMASNIKNVALLRSTADNRARAELAKLGDTMAAALVDRLWKSKARPADEQGVGVVITPLSAATLAGAEIIDHYQEGGVQWALARVAIDNVKTGIEGLSSLNAEGKTYMIGDADAAHTMLIAKETDPCAKGSPIISESGSVEFTYAGAAESVRVVGDFAPTSPTNYYWAEDGLPLTKLSEKCHLRVARFETDARLDYAYVVDGKRVVDPKNARKIFSGVAGGITVSELVMPEHEKPWAPDPKRKIKKGKLSAFAATTKVTIYTPPGYSNKKKYPILYTADGSAWAEHLGLPTLLDQMIADGAIAPVVAVMIDPMPDRSAWYTPNEGLVTYIAKIVEDVEAKHPASKRVHAGTSAGARATVFVGLSRPDLFPNLAVLSASLGPDPQLAPAAPEMDAWISAGTYEGAIAEQARLLEKHFPKATVTITHEGHSFGAWRARLPTMLKHFFPNDRPKG